MDKQLLCILRNLIDPVCAVEGHGGGWGYSAHSVEAIRFCADADILLGGLGLFGGRGEYTAKIKVSLLVTLNKNTFRYMYFFFCHVHNVHFMLYFVLPVILDFTLFVIGHTRLPKTLIKSLINTINIVQLFELGPDGGDHETDGDLLAETDVLAYDCAAR